jgi:hypothetical protein
MGDKKIINNLYDSFPFNKLLNNSTYPDDNEGYLYYLINKEFNDSENYDVFLNNFTLFYANSDNNERYKLLLILLKRYSPGNQKLLNELLKYYDSDFFGVDLSSEEIKILYKIINNLVSSELKIEILTQFYKVFYNDIYKNDLYNNNDNLISFIKS